MKRIIVIFLILALGTTLRVRAQKVETMVGDAWAEIPVLQTQSELKPGWKIVDYQMKSKLIHYLSGGRATQLTDGDRPAFRITPGEEEVLVDYVVIRLKAAKYYRKIPKSRLMDNDYMRLEPSRFDIKAENEAFICRPLQPFKAGEYILVSLSQSPIGELQDLLVYPFSVIQDASRRP